VLQERIEDLSMKSKDSTGNTNGLQGNAKLNWEKEKKLLARCGRELKLIDRQDKEKTENPDLSWEEHDRLISKYLKESEYIKKHREEREQQKK
jgi:hypothetical protein